MKCEWYQQLKNIVEKKKKGGHLHPHKLSREENYLWIFSKVVFWKILSNYLQLLAIHVCLSAHYHSETNSTFKKNTRTVSFLKSTALNWVCWGINLGNLSVAIPPPQIMWTEMHMKAKSFAQCSTTVLFSYWKHKGKFLSSWHNAKVSKACFIRKQIPTHFPLYLFGSCSFTLSIWVSKIFKALHRNT